MFQNYCRTYVTGATGSSSLPLPSLRSLSASNSGIWNKFPLFSGSRCWSNEQRQSITDASEDKLQGSNSRKIVWLSLSLVQNAALGTVGSGISSRWEYNETNVLYHLYSVSAGQIMLPVFFIYILGSSLFCFCHISFAKEFLSTLNNTFSSAVIWSPDLG